MVSNRLTHRRTSISNPKICKSKLKPLRPLPPEPPPQWPPPYIRATLKVRGAYDRFDFDLTLLPNHQTNPTLYRGFSEGDVAYVSITSKIGPTTSIFTPNNIAVDGPYEYFAAAFGTPVQIPNNAFKFLNDTWQFKSPSNAEITLIAAYP